MFLWYNWSFFKNSYLEIMLKIRNIVKIKNIRHDKY